MMIKSHRWLSTEKFSAGIAECRRWCMRTGTELRAQINLSCCCSSKQDEQQIGGTRLKKSRYTTEPGVTSQSSVD